jgi:hypothetical protein
MQLQVAEHISDIVDHARPDANMTRKGDQCRQRFASRFLLAMGWAREVAVVLLAVGRVLYSVGAVFCAVRWPHPWPTTFGYHEFFRACTGARGDLPLHRHVLRGLLLVDRELPRKDSDR